MDISLSGLKRTNARVVEKKLNRFLGEEGELLDLNEVRALILETGVLEPLNITVAAGEEGSVLQVDVREKWALFPIPLVFLSSSRSQYGGAFVDFNAFGRLDNFFLVGMYSGDSWLAVGSYAHTPLSAKLPGWRASVFLSDGDKRDMDQKGKAFREYGLFSLTASLGLDYGISEFLDASLGLSFNRRSPEGGDGSAPPSNDYYFAGIKPELSLKKSAWDGYLLSRQSISAEYTWMIGINSPSFHSTALEGIYEKSLLPGFRLNIQGGAVYSPLAPAFFENSPFRAKVTILPPGFSARNIAGISLGLEKHLFRTSFGTLSLAAAWQGVVSQGPVLGTEADQGVSASVVFYLSKLAIPAFGLGIAYNITAAYLQGSFSVGMNF
jgi:hypothetical protein